MQYLFSRDASQPIRENDTVILMVHNKGGFTVKIERGKTIKICKDKLKIDTLIGCSYGDVFTKESGEWIKIKRNDPNYHKYRNRIREEPADDSINVTHDNRDIQDTNTAQKLTYDEIQQMKKDMNPQDLIDTIVDNSETFCKKTKMAQEKYIMRKEARHVKLFYVRPCDLYNVCNCYFNSFPHKIGYLNAPNLGMMIYMANIRYGDKVMVLDHSLGLITGAISQRLAGSGKIYRLVTKGVSDKIVHEMGVTYFDNIFSIDMEEYLGKLSRSKATNSGAIENSLLNVESTKNGNPASRGASDNNSATEEFINSIEDGKTTENVSNNSEDRQADTENSKRLLKTEDATEDEEHVEGTTATKKQAINGIYPLHHPQKEELLDCQVVIGNVSFNKCDKLNRIVKEYTCKMKEAADRYLEMGGRFVVFGQQYQPMAALQADLTSSGNYVNVKFDEMFIREYQMIHLRTHPLMKAEVRPFCGFILSATKTSSNII